MASITSPNYPNLYPPNSQCYYYIRAPQFARITLQFTDFNIPCPNPNLNDDTIEIRYYHLGKFICIICVHPLVFFSSSLGQPGPKYCGSGVNSNEFKILSTKNYIMLVFKTNQNYAGRGFHAQANLAQ